MPPSEPRHPQPTEHPRAQAGGGAPPVPVRGGALTEGPGHQVVVSQVRAVVADGAVPPVPLFNLANILTIFRIVLVPFFLVALFVADGQSTLWRVVAGVIFVVAAVTDRFDGQLARKHGWVTDFGKIADPIADKALMGGALVGLSVLGELSWWVTGLILFRELGITALRFWVIRHGVIPASRGGKIKTAVQTLAIGLYVFPLPEWLGVFSGAMMAAALVITLVTGADYVVQAVRMRARGRAAHAGSAG